MPDRKDQGKNEPPVLDVEKELRFARRAGMPLMFAGESDELRPLGGDFPHYIGQRAGPAVHVIRVGADGLRQPLDPRRDLIAYVDIEAAMDGRSFDIGFGRSGAAQLALALAADVLEDDRAACELHLELRNRVTEQIKTRRWRLNALDLRRVLDEAAEERRKL